MGELKLYDSAVRSRFRASLKVLQWLNTFRFKQRFVFPSPISLIRRGLVNSNALTGSVVSLATSAAAFWMLLPFFVPLSALWASGHRLFHRRRFLCSGHRTNSRLPSGSNGLESRDQSPLVNSAPIFSSLLAVSFLGEVWVLQNIIGTALVIIRVIILLFRSSPLKVMAKIRCHLSDSRRAWPSASRPRFGKPA